MHFGSPGWKFLSDPFQTEPDSTDDSGLDFHFKKISIECWTPTPFRLTHFPSSCHGNSFRLSPTCQCAFVGACFESVYWLLPSPSPSSASSSSSTRGAWRLAWEPSLKKTFLITPDLGARIVCCRHKKTTFLQTQRRVCVYPWYAKWRWECVWAGRSLSPPSSWRSWPWAGLLQPLCLRPSPAPKTQHNRLFICVCLDIQSLFITTIKIRPVMSLSEEVIYVFMT